MNGIGGNLLKKEIQSPPRNISFTEQMKGPWIEPYLCAERPIINRLIKSTTPLEQEMRPLQVCHHENITRILDGICVLPTEV
jgi:hypothetical protein